MLFYKVLYCRLFYILTLVIAFGFVVKIYYIIGSNRKFTSYISKNSSSFIAAEVHNKMCYNNLDEYASVYGDDRAIMNSSALAGHRIPSILHVQWKTVDLRKKHSDILLKWRQLHPKWLIIFWTDEAMTNFINSKLDKTIRDTYKKLPQIILKVDFMRYVIMHHFGEVYADLDVEPLQSLEPLMDHHSCIVCRELEPNPMLVNFNTAILASNFVLMSRPNHPFWTFLIEHVSQRKPSHPVTWTGPLAVTDALRRYEQLSRHRTREDAVFLAPSLYFSSPYPEKGDAPHLSLLRGFQCSRKVGNSIPMVKRICRVFLKEKRIDYSDAYLHPRHFNESFARHHMTGTWFQTEPWLRSGGVTSVWKLISNVAMYGTNKTIFKDSDFNPHVTSAFDVDKRVNHGT